MQPPRSAFVCHFPDLSPQRTCAGSAHRRRRANKAPGSPPLAAGALSFEAPAVSLVNRSAACRTATGASWTDARWPTARTQPCAKTWWSRAKLRTLRSLAAPTLVRPWRLSSTPCQVHFLILHARGIALRAVAHAKFFMQQLVREHARARGDIFVLRNAGNTCTHAAWHRLIAPLAYSQRASLRAHLVLSPAQLHVDVYLARTSCKPKACRGPRLNRCHSGLRVAAFNA